jgi:hypothetical protein
MRVAGPYSSNANTDCSNGCDDGNVFSVLAATLIANLPIPISADPGKDCQKDRKKYWRQQLSRPLFVGPALGSRCLKVLYQRHYITNVPNPNSGTLIPGTQYLIGAAEISLRK